jgi:hypothetical protein
MVCQIIEYPPYETKLSFLRVQNLFLNIYFVLRQLQFDYVRITDKATGSQRANSCSSGQGIVHLVSKPNVCHRFHKRSLYILQTSDINIIVFSCYSRKEEQDGGGR